MLKGQTMDRARRSPRPKFDRVITVEDSSVISGCTYDHVGLILDVQFKPSERIYRYLNVTPLEFTKLITSKSTGKVFNATIKAEKECRKLTRTEL